MVKGQKWILTKHFEGEPKADNLELTEDVLSDELNENEVLTEALFLSVDAYMRVFTRSLTTPCVMMGEQVAKVIKSKNAKFPVGTIVNSNAGWRTHYISKNGEDLQPVAFDLGKNSPSYLLGLLGMPGATAYFGLKQLDPKAGETIVITSAAGTVGSTVGQLAKLKGLKVIAFAGGDDKVDWLKKDLGFDHVFNYKKVDFSEALSKVAPDGVDLFYDNVGGDWFNTIIAKHMRYLGRVTVCGVISGLNESTPKLYPSASSSILIKGLTVKAVQVYTHKKNWGEAHAEFNKYLSSGQIKTTETIHDFEKMREAFYGLFKGESIGKPIIKYTPK